MSFSIHGGATSLHPASEFPWPGVQVKITQGVSEPLIRGMRSQRAGRGRGLPAGSVGEGLNPWMLVQWTLVSLQLIPMPRTGTSPSLS